MIVEEVKDGSRERQVIVSMLFDSTVAARVALRWERRMCRSRVADIVGGWAISHFRKYSKPLGMAVQTKFEDWAKSFRNKETVELVDSFLSGLRGDHKKHIRNGTDPNYLSRLAEDHFDSVRLERACHAMSSALDSGDVVGAWKLHAECVRTGISIGSMCDPFSVDDPITCFDENEESIVSFPGDLGRFFGSDLCRGAFLSFMGSDKSGKSFMLMELAYRIMSQRRRVLFVETGDLTEKEMKRRLYVRAAGHPYFSPDGKWPAVVNVPDRIFPPAGTDVAVIKIREKKFNKKIDIGIVQEAKEKVRDRVVKSQESYFKMSCFPNSTVSVDQIESIIDDLARQNWIVDACLIDYADILADPPGFHKDNRDKTNANWKNMSRLRQEKNILLVTATQSNAEAYEKKTMSKRNFSEDKRKMAHVTGMIGINKILEEEELGIIRLNWLVRRNEKPCRQVHVAGCLALANPAMLSTFGKSEGNDGRE